MRTITITELQRKPAATIEYIASSVEPVIMRRPKGRHIAIEAISACNRRVATIKWLSDQAEVDFILKSLRDSESGCYLTYRKVGLTYHVTSQYRSKFEAWQRRNMAQARRILLRASNPRANSPIPLLGMLEGCFCLVLGFEQPGAILYKPGPSGPILLDHHVWQASDGQVVPWAL